MNILVIGNAIGPFDLLLISFCVGVDWNNLSCFFTLLSEIAPH